MRNIEPLKISRHVVDDSESFANVAKSDFINTPRKRLVTEDDTDNVQNIAICFEKSICFEKYPRLSNFFKFSSKLKYYIIIIETYVYSKIVTKRVAK